MEVEKMEHGAHNVIMTESETIQLFINLVILGSIVGSFVGYLFAFFGDKD